MHVEEQMRGFKFAVGAALSMLAVSPVWATGQVETGRQIVAACKAYLALPEGASDNALHPQHHCRQFIASFLSAYAAGENARTASRVTGTGSSGSEACVRLPDYLSFRDMAARMIPPCSTTWRRNWRARRLSMTFPAIPSRPNVT
jgi:hypothetical protein